MALIVVRSSIADYLVDDWVLMAALISVGREFRKPYVTTLKRATLSGVEIQQYAASGSS